METNLQSNEVRIPKSPQSPGACPQFKSTFARSLSFNTSSQQPSKPLDFEINFRIAQHPDHLANINGSLSTKMTPPHKIDDIEEDFEEFMRNSPLKHSLQNGSATTTGPTVAAAAATTATTPPTRKNATASRVFNATCSGRHRFQVTLTRNQIKHFFLILFCLFFSATISTSFLHIYFCLFKNTATFKSYSQ